MSVVVSQEPASSNAVPGGDAVSHTVRVRNSGDTVEEYRFSVVGPLAGWATVEPTQLRLYPGDESTTTVTFAVPKDRRVLAGPTAFGVRVVPQVHPELSDVIEGVITITPFAEMHAELVPVTVRGRGSARLQLAIENRGNAVLPVRLRGRDQEDMVLFEGVEAPIHIPPGATGRPVVVVRPRRGRLTGPPERFPLTVDVTPSPDAQAAGARAVQLRGTFVRSARTSKAALVTLGLLLVAALLAGLAIAGVSASRGRGLSLSSLFSSSSDQRTGAPPATFAPPATRSSSSGGGGGGGGGGGDDGGGSARTVTIAHNGHALTAQPGVFGVGGRTPQTEPVGTAGQSWRLLRAQNGSLVIVPSDATDTALDQPRSDDGAALDLGDVDDGRVPRSQTWTLRPAGGNQPQLVNGATGDCLSDVGDGRPVVGARCQDGARAQLWAIAAS